jgi:hypothetical protein
VQKRKTTIKSVITVFIVFSGYYLYFESTKKLIKNPEEMACYEQLVAIEQQRPFPELNKRQAVYNS